MLQLCMSLMNRMIPVTKTLHSVELVPMCLTILPHISAVIAKKISVKIAHMGIKFLD